MASTMFDSVLYRDVFSTPAMRAVFSDEALLKAYVQAEVALAVAQGETGVIPREAAQAIADKAPAIALDSAQLKTDTENVGYPIVGLVRQLSQQLGEAVLISTPTARTVSTCQFTRISPAICWRRSTGASTPSAA